MNIGNIIPKEKPLNLSEKSKWTNPINNWYKGKPTEDGLYIIIIHPYGSCANEPKYFCYTIEDGILKDCIDDGNIDADDFWSQYAIAWQRIEPYRG